MNLLPLLCILPCVLQVHSQDRRVGRLMEVYAWKQLSYNIDGTIYDRDDLSGQYSNGLNNGAGQGSDRGDSRPSNNLHFGYDDDDDRDRNTQNYYPSYPSGNYNGYKSSPSDSMFDNSAFMRSTIPKRDRADSENSFYIRYNNVPMGAEKVGDRLFVTIPRRRYGIPATLNYLVLSEDRVRSPALRPYPSLQVSRSLVNVYRTRADECGRLWMVDTGLLEVPDTPRQIQRPAIVVFDLQTDRQIFRYELKDSDVPSNSTPTGLASITVDTSPGCDSSFAYIPDLVTYGLIVFSLREMDSWRIENNYFHFNPAVATLDIAGQHFQWNDGIFSITLAPGSGCRTAYFHPMISYQEFSVNTCMLNNRTAASDSAFWEQFHIVGDRGPNTQSTMHDIHDQSQVMFFAEIGRDAVSCWSTRRALTPENVVLLARDSTKLSYPADLHVTGDEVWVIANALPRFGYASLDPNEYNFFIYKAYVSDLIEGTRCAERFNQYYLN